MDEEGVIVQIGYSAPTSALGFGSLSFADAVRNEHIIEKTLAEAGVKVDEGSVSLPPMTRWRIRRTRRTEPP